MIAPGNRKEQGGSGEEAGKQLLVKLMVRMRHNSDDDDRS